MKSMTGFGAGRVPAPGGHLSVEIKSVNSRFLELRLGLPREQQALEGELRRLVQSKIERGRVEVSVRREGRAKRANRIEVDLKLAHEVADAWSKVSRALRIDGPIDLGFLRSASGEIVRSVEEAPDPAADEKSLRKALDRALVAHDRDRCREGRHLRRDMGERLKNLMALRRRAAKLAAAARPELLKKLRKRIDDLAPGHGAEPGRLVQEVALAVDRADVSEELARLESHFDALRKLLSASEPVGKRIEFLLQEILREVNTIGSKANQLALTEVVLEAKGEIEKLREQVANVE
jgi:uncharacterized protein (TIGR00255 family)